MTTSVKGTGRSDERKAALTAYNQYAKKFRSVSLRVLNKLPFSLYT